MTVFGGGVARNRNRRRSPDCSGRARGLAGELDGVGLAMSMNRSGRQPDLFTSQGDLFGAAAGVPAWVKHPDMVERVRGEVEGVLAGLRGAVVFPFRDASAAMSAEIRFTDMAEIWLPPEVGHPLQVAFAVEMARLGEAVDYPIYDWIGRHRPAPEG